MTIEEINKLIIELKTTKYSEDNKTNYSEYYSKVSKVIHGERSIMPSPYETQTLNLHRGRKNYDGKLFYNLGELWYLPNEFASAQRFNLEGRPMFYAGNDLSTALIELRPSGDEVYTIIEIGLNVPELRCIQFVEEKLGNASEAMKPINKAAWQFIMDESVKEVDSDRPQDYYATQIYAQSVRDTASQHFDAIAYNSVATTLKGYNFVIKPEFIDKHYVLKKVHVLKVYDYNSKEDFKVKCLLRSNDITKFGRILYKPVIGCNGHHISLKNYRHDEA